MIWAFKGLLCWKGWVLKGWGVRMIWAFEGMLCWKGWVLEELVVGRVGC